LCYFPPQTGYGLQQRLSRNEMILERLKSGAKNPYGKDMPELSFVAKSLGAAMHIQIGTKDRSEIDKSKINLLKKL
jgi:hypothetical protein